MNKINKINLFQFTIKVVFWIVRVFKLSLCRGPKPFIVLLQRLDSHRRNRGIIDTIILVKEIRTHLYNYLSGTPIFESESRKLRIHSSGLPVILGDLIQIVESSLTLDRFDDLRLLTTILCCTRALSLGKDVSYEPITSPPKGVAKDISKHVTAFWAELGFPVWTSRPKALNWRTYHLSTKVGPGDKQMGNALWQAFTELDNLPRQLISDIKLIAGPKLADYMSVLQERKLDERYQDAFSGILNFWPDWTTIRKLSAFPDKELKTRVVAIGDYWSQTALLPLHSYLYKILRRIPQDNTFNQAAASDKVANKEIYYSVDLTAATDRFPIDTIFSVLAGRLPLDYLNAWRNIMVGYPFECPDGTVKQYSVGNPMGFYSSWASFALAHHYVLFYCCKELNIPWKDAPYALLGDDIVICHKELAELYKETITSLGVEFSASKTYTSPHFYEFAKRLFYRGVEVSPFPISGLSAVQSKYYLLCQFFLEAEGKGWVSPYGAPVAVQKYFGSILNLPKSFQKKTLERSYIYEHVQRIVRGADNAGELLGNVFRIMGHNFTMSNYVAHSVLENIVVEMFAESNPVNKIEDLKKEGKFTLPVLEAMLITELLSKLQDIRIESFEFIGCLPTTGVVSNITHSFQDLSKKAVSHSTDGTWPLLLKTMAFPISSEILSMRGSFMIARTISKLNTYLKDRASILEFYPAEELLRVSGYDPALDGPR